MKGKQLTMEEFPNSKLEPFEQTSPESGNYNCIAWALEDEKHFYWPGPADSYNWPPGLRRGISVKNLTRIFELAGYQACENSELEPGFQKVAIFSKNKLPTHAARQLPDGLWTSKIGALEDVRHTLNAISGGIYGEVALVLKRPNPL